MFLELISVLEYMLYCLLLDRERAAEAEECLLVQIALPSCQVISLNVLRNLMYYI